MTRYFLLTILVLLGGYGLFEAWPLLAGPSLSIDSPENNASFPQGMVSVKGNVKRVAMLTLDGESVLRDQSGDFSSTLTFPKGESILTFIATDQFGRRITATRAIFVPN